MHVRRLQLAEAQFIQHIASSPSLAPFSYVSRMPWSVEWDQPENDPNQEAILHDEAERAPADDGHARVWAGALVRGV